MCTIFKVEAMYTYICTVLATFCLLICLVLDYILVSNRITDTIKFILVQSHEQLFFKHDICLEYILLNFKMHFKDYEAAIVVGINQ